MPKERLKVMWDYDAFPVWGPNGASDPTEVEISERLRGDLMAWSDELTDEYWGKYGPDDPRTSPPSLEARRAWDQRGRGLAARLQAEVGDDFEVVYQSEETGALEELAD